ncbi:hypothetical protein [Salinisphaera sp.]|uniref:hypothetical protein n=1 Tax=Salinisphaera sp. TaxID=1914330 RepID=UPI0025D36610|nr:hypothetical protein [Salinisphaera sp.]
MSAADHLVHLRLFASIRGPVSCPNAAGEVSYTIKNWAIRKAAFVPRSSAQAQRVLHRSDVGLRAIGEPAAACALQHAWRATLNFYRSFGVYACAVPHCTTWFCCAGVVLLA